MNEWKKIVIIFKFVLDFVAYELEVQQSNRLIYVHRCD